MRRVAALLLFALLASGLTYWLLPQSSRWPRSVLDLPSAMAQVPISQCVTSAVAGGTANALTIATLPCIPTTALLILQVTTTNTASNPTLQYPGGPAQIILNFNASTIGSGFLTAGGKFLLVNNGTNWFVLSAGPIANIVPTNTTTLLDPRNYGAYGDTVNLVNYATTIANNSCALTVTGASFSASTDPGKAIVITNANPSLLTASFSTTIASVQGPTQVTLSSCWPNTGLVAVNEEIRYGHDDTTALNSTVAAAQNLQTLLPYTMTGQTQINGGGLAYGVSSLSFNVNAELSNIALTGLTSTAGQCVLDIGGESSTGSHVTVDASWLNDVTPICLASGVNGTTRWKDLIWQNWYGSSATTISLSGVTSESEAIAGTSSIGSCNGSAPYSCTMTVNGSVTGTIQPGQLVTGTGVPSGTYVQQWVNARGAGIGGAGTYIVGNPVSNPTESSSETFIMYGVQLTFSGGSAAPTPGMIFHGGQTGIQNGAVVTSTCPAVSSQVVTFTNGSANIVLASTPITVGCPIQFTTTGSLPSGFAINTTYWVLSINTLTVTVGDSPGSTAITAASAGSGTQSALGPGWLTLNQAPTQAISSGSYTLSSDANGFYLPEASGFHCLTCIGRQTNFLGYPSAEFGFSLFDDSRGGTDFKDCNIGFGVAPIFLGPDSASNQFRTCATSQNISNESALEINAASVIIADNANTVLLDDFIANGQIQAFKSTSAVVQYIDLIKQFPAENSGVAWYAPNTCAWFYSFVTGATAQRIVRNPMGIEQNACDDVAFTTGGSGSWTEYPQWMQAALAEDHNVYLPEQANLPVTIPSGLYMVGSTIQSAESQRTPFSTSFSFAETDSAAFFTASVSGATTVTIPNTISPTNTQNWHVLIVNPTVSTVTVEPAAGATMYYGGSSVASEALTQNEVYQLDCPSNSNGTSAVCYLSLL